jgi:hypothetical protein
MYILGWARAPPGLPGGRGGGCSEGPFASFAGAAAGRHVTRTAVARRIRPGSFAAAETGLPPHGGRQRFAPPCRSGPRALS